MSGGESRLLARLEAAIRAESDPVRGGCLRAEWAVLQARQGRTDVARNEIAALRKEFDGRQTFELMAWICAVESLAANYSNLGQEALDWMKRALALSTSAGLRRLKALSATSLAHMALYRDAPEEMGKCLKIALPELGHADGGTIARAYLAVAMATHWGGQFELAKPWYRAARKQAAADGDDVTLGALSRQLSGLRAVSAKAGAIFGEPYEDDARHALTGAESSGNLDLHIGTVTQDAVLPHVKASVAAIQGRFQEAIEIYQSLLPRIDTQGLGDTEAHVLADMSWCFVNIGDEQQARQYAKRAMEAHSDSDHVEDQAVALGRLSQVYRAFGDVGTEREFTERSRSALAAYRLLQQRFLDAVAVLEFPAEGFKTNS